MVIDLDKAATQADLAALVGVSQQAISALVQDGKLAFGGTVGEMLQAYCQRLRDQAAGRLGAEGGGLDLVQERAALARSQRVAQDMKNAIACGEYAPIGLLSDVLGKASSAVVDRFEQLEGALKRSCPNMPDDVRATVFEVITSSRNAWIKSTAQLVAASMNPDDADDTSPPEPAEADDA